MPDVTLLQQAFIPPREKPWFIKVAQRIAPWIYRVGLDAYVALDAESVERLRSLRGQPGLIVLNHPTIYDPVFAFGLSRYVGERWGYLCALEIFRELHPLAATALTWLNVYSVRRGALDRLAIKMTCTLLRNNRKVVLFPEGETYGLNDALLPFQEGAIQIGFWALQERETQSQPGPLWVVPVALKYRFLGDAETEIERRLGRLEVHLGLSPSGGDFLRRVIRAGEAVLARLEQEYQVPPPPGADLNQRISFLRTLMLERVAEALHVHLRPQWTLQEKIRALFNAVHGMLYGHDPQVPADDSGERREWEAVLRLFHRQVARLHAFQAVQGGYIPSYPTPERFLDLIIRLEWEVTGRASPYRPRVAEFRVEEALDLATFGERYRMDKRGTVALLTEEMRNRLQRGLRRLIARTQPLPGLDLAAVPYRVNPEAYLMPEVVRRLPEDAR